MEERSDRSSVVDLIFPGAARGAWFFF